VKKIFSLVATAAALALPLAVTPAAAAADKAAPAKAKKAKKAKKSMRKTTPRPQKP
jgi:hypothetical protein